MAAELSPRSAIERAHVRTAGTGNGSAVRVLAHVGGLAGMTFFFTRNLPILAMAIFWIVEVGCAMASGRLVLSELSDLNGETRHPLAKDSL